MAETVKVSLLQSRSFRASKTENYTHYKRGIVEMPVAHAKAMGLLHRAVREAKGEEGQVVRDSFTGTFDNKLTSLLNEAGYHSLEDLRGLSSDELLAIPGVGPAAYERIDIALKGG